MQPNQKKVLFITYFFPPNNASATHRIAKFSKYLPQFKWKPLIIAPKKTIGQNHDQELFEEIKNKVFLYPTFSLASLFPNTSHTSSQEENNNSPKKTKKQQLFKFNIPIDPQILWIPFVIFKALKIIRKEKPKILFVSGYPFSLFLAGTILKKLTKTPLVLSFHDPWTLNPYMTRWNTWLSRKLESWCIKTSNACVFTTKGTQRLYEKAFPKQSKKFETIYNGFDTENFTYPTQEKPQNPDKIHINHIGSLADQRSPEPIIEILNHFLQTHPELKTKIQINFFGTISPHLQSETKQLINKYKLENNISFHGFIPHAKAIKKLQQSDALLFITGNKTNGEYIVPGKTFEYIASHKPIFASTYSEGEAAQILKKSGLGHVVPQNNIKEASKTLYDLYEQLQTNTINQQIDKEFINQFSRKNLTKQLSEIFNQLENTKKNS